MSPLTQENAITCLHVLVLSSWERMRSAHIHDVREMNPAEIYNDTYPDTVAILS